MVIKPSEKKPGLDLQKHIGFWKGTLVACNPTADQIKKYYKLSEEDQVEEPVYQGKTKDDKDWAMVNFLFEEEVQKIAVPYRVFVSKELAEFEKDGVTKAWYVNQFGESQLVADKKDLFRSFTHLQKWNKETSKMEDVLDESGKAIELSWRKAWKGEKQIYDLMRKLVTQDWFEANTDTNLLLKIDQLMRGNLKEITSWIGTENYQPVVGCIEIQAKDGENGVNYYQNCVDGAWMAGWKIKEANIATSSNSWNTYEEKSKNKGKTRDVYQFYQAVKRCKNITELKPIHEFDPSQHIAAGDSAIQHSDAGGEVKDIDY